MPTDFFIKMSKKFKCPVSQLKRLFAATGLLFLFPWTFGQDKPDLTFDIADFSRKAEVAEWLCAYDEVAWRTTDSVLVQDSAELVRLGPEWFCFQTKNKLWHAVYGKYQNNRYDLVFHYVVDTLNRVSRTFEPVDTSMLFPCSRALNTANRQVQPMKDTMDIGFNQFIRKNEDSTFTVWIFPSFQSDNYAVYGGEFIYIIDPSGERIIRNDSYFQGQFRAFKNSDGTWSWMHAEKEEK
jgi:hypothetical protein